MARQNRKRTRNNRAVSPDESDASPQDQINIPDSPNNPFSPAAEVDVEDLMLNQELVDDLPVSSDDGEDLFGPEVDKDYAENPELDQYETFGLDEGEYDALSIQQRREVDLQLDARDRLATRGPEAIFQSDGEDLLNANVLRRRHLLGLNEPYLNVPEEEDFTFTANDLSDIKAGSVAEWISMEGPRKAIHRQFKRFLTSEQGPVGSTYVDKVRKMVEENKESLEVNYSDLMERDPALAYLLVNAPRPMLQIFDAVAFDTVLQTFRNYDKIHSEIHCRVTDILVTNSLRDLRQIHLNCLVRVKGVVSRRSTIFPQLKYVKYKCGKCGITLGPFYQDPNSPTVVKVSNCSNCESKGPFIESSEQTVYRNFQKITLQETPGSVPAGRLPRHREVILLWDLVDSVKPGDEIEVTGIYQNNFDVSLNNRHGFPVFSTIIEANYIATRDTKTSVAGLTNEDLYAINDLAKDPSIGKRIIHSIAPSIYGHLDIKTALAYSLFGGCAKIKDGNHHVRGDINTLLLGDPGTSKSQFLKYAEKTAHRCVYTTGQGASAVGLTASVRKDPITREWTLEGGALVLADQGVCLIDEFDKMNEKDRTSIHEAMEQQSISIAKAGIVTSLQARCAIIAAANPIRGRYNPTLPLTRNVDLTGPILSRFDCIIVVRDTIDPTSDFQLANFVLDSHDRAHPESYSSEPPKSTNEDSIKPIDQDLLRKYIIYARSKDPTRILEMNEPKIQQLYCDLRAAASNCGGMAITVRHLESIIRMAEANARMHLRDTVRADDFDRAISFFLDTFIQTQKISVMKTLRRSFKEFFQTDRDNFHLLDSLLARLATESIKLYQHTLNQSDANIGELDVIPQSLSIPVDEFATRAHDMSIFDINPFLKSKHLAELGYTLESSTEIDPSLPPGPDGRPIERPAEFLVKVLRK